MPDANLEPIITKTEVGGKITFQKLLSNRMYLSFLLYSVYDQSSIKPHGIYEKKKAFHLSFSLQICNLCQDLNA